MLKGIAFAVIASGLICLVPGYTVLDTTEDSVYDMPLQLDGDVCDPIACDKSCKEYDVPGFCHEGKGCRCQGLDSPEDQVPSEKEYPDYENCDPDTCLQSCRKERRNVKDAICTEAGSCQCKFHETVFPLDCSPFRCDEACRRDDKELISTNCTVRNTCMCYYKQHCSERLCRDICARSPKKLLKSHCRKNDKCYCSYAAAYA